MATVWFEWAYVFSWGVIASYLRRAEDEYQGHNHIKSILNPRRARCFLSAHYPIYYQGYYGIDEEGQPVIAHQSLAGCRPLQRISLAHYSMKSWEDWQKRRQLGKADAPGQHDVSWEAFAKADAPLGKVEDDSLLRLREKLLGKEGGRLRIVAEAPKQPREYEKLLQESLKNYASMTLEEFLAIYHLYESDGKGDNLSREQMQDMVLSLLHLRFSASEVISVPEYDMLWDEIRQMRNLHPGWQLLQRDLARLTVLVRQQKIQSARSLFDSYIDRLIESHEPNYRPRVALVTPDLEDRPETRGLLLLARLLIETGMEVVLYSADDGSLRQEFYQAGLIAIVQDGGLLQKTLDRTHWQGGYDLICLNTCKCARLLHGHSSPVPRPLLWWIHQGEENYFEDELLWRGIDQYMLTTVVADDKIISALRRIDANWPISGRMPLPQAGQEKEFGTLVMPVLESLVHMGISHRIPFEEGIR